MLVIDLGQSGSRARQNVTTTTSPRGKRNGETVLETLRAIFQELPKTSAEVVALSCTGFNGIVTDADKYGDLCKEFFGSSRVAVIDDGFAGFIGALNGRDGVVLSIGGGVVSIGGRNGMFSHRDGLGSTFGDEGGGFWLGALAITKSLALRQGRGKDDQMLEYFADECKKYDQLTIKDGAEASTLAINTAKKVLDAADLGIPTAVSIVSEGSLLLAQTVVATWLGAGGDNKDVVEIVIQGGPAKNSQYVQAIFNQIRIEIPHAVLAESKGDNLDGATWIAENMDQDQPPLLLWATP
jgi:N-acetylglucosamine kinase-like BadF-type ATPase